MAFCSINSVTMLLLFNFVSYKCLHFFFSYRYRKHQICICSSERHHSTVKLKRIQSGLDGNTQNSGWTQEFFLYPDQGISVNSIKLENGEYEKGRK